MKSNSPTGTTQQLTCVLSKLALAGTCILPLLSCSLDPYEGRGRLNILLAPEPQAAEALSTLRPFSAIGALATPSEVGDFSCFTVNVTGAGIPQDPKFVSRCKPGSDNMQGRGTGLFAEPVGAGVPVELTVPAGAARTIDVYGMYPAITQCGGTGGNTPSGYFLGTKTLDLFESASVTIPISFQNGASASFDCTGGSAYGSHRAFGNGSDGARIISSVISDITTDTSLLGTRTLQASAWIRYVNTIDAKTLQAHAAFTAADFRPGDEVLWMVMAATGPSACGGGLQVGNYGFDWIRDANYAGNYLYLEHGISAAPGTLNSAAINQAATNNPASPFCRIQLIRVPQFSSLTFDGSAAIASLRAPAYSMSTGRGGVVVVKVAGQVTLAGGNGKSIDVGGKGFAGGVGASTIGGGLTKGDGSVGGAVVPGNSSDVSPNGTGGGVKEGSDGGGGGNYGAGGSAGGFALGGGTNTCGGGQGCAYLGGGGGGGNLSNPGGKGGGVILFHAKSFNVQSGVLDLEAYGAAATGGHSEGGGAGGTIYFQMQVSDNTAVTLDVSGGAGGNGASYGGGGGGGGRVDGVYCAGTSPSPAVAGGVGGPASSAGQAGAAGGSSLNATPAAAFCGE